MFDAAIHGKDHARVGGVLADHLYIDRGVEVALLLHEVANIVHALVQQIVVDRSLLKDRNQQV